MKKFAIIVLGLIISNMLYALALDANSWYDSKIAYYNRVKMCFPGRFENEEGTIVYRVYGRTYDSCDISERKGRRVFRCIFSLDTAKEYAAEGLNSMKNNKDKDYMLSDFIIKNKNITRQCRTYNIN